MGWRLRWSRSSWRVRVGWVLLGWALVTVSVGLPVWAATAGDLDEVAGWANVLALPVTALGLVLVLADRGRPRLVGEVPAGRRRPWMAPPLDRMVERPELGERLIAALLAPGVADIGLTTGLQGAGGFGKTRLAAWLCHRPEVNERYPGGLLWVTVGQEVHGADLAERINDVAVVLGGQRPAIADPDVAGGELGRLLDDREPVLLVIDDVWEESQLRPFRLGGRGCTRLVTTRIPELLPASATRIRVDAMSDEQARALVTDGVPGLPAGTADRLAELAGRWPVLLNLVNGVLRRRVARGQPCARAAAEIVDSLVAHGPAVFDPARPVDRSRAVEATIRASLVLLDPADRNRYLDLAIFPEDVEIPVDVLRLLWPDCRVEALVEEMVGLGLVADYRLDAPGPRLILHDVIRAYLRMRRPAADRASVHRRLVDQSAGLLPADGQRVLVPWWLLPADAGYLWRYLPWHLNEAGSTDELTALVGDLRWVEAKTARFGSVVAVEADLALVDTPTTNLLLRTLRRDAHVLVEIDPPAALGATLASRLHGVGGLEVLLDSYRPTLPYPRLEPAWPLPDAPDPTRSLEATGHTGAVTDCAFSPDGTLLATTSADATVRLWRIPDGAECGVLNGHTDRVTGCAFSPDGTLLATTGDDATVRLWRMPEGVQLAVLTGHTGQVTSCTFAPDGGLLATGGRDGTVRLWRMPDLTQQRVLGNHTGSFGSCAFSPDGVLLATTRDGTIRLWRVSDGAEQKASGSETGRLNTCRFSPDGTLLAAAGSAGTVWLRRMPGGAEHATLTGHLDAVLGCAFSPDGQWLATTSWDQTVRLWRTSDGTEAAVLTGHTSWVIGCAFSPDGALLATVSEDATVRLWHMPHGTPHAVLAGPISPVVDCAFSPDGTALATGGYDATVHLWPISDGGTPKALAGHTSRILGCAYSPDGDFLATTSYDRTARLWRMPDGRQQNILSGHAAAVTCCAFTPDGSLLATTSYDATVRLWRVPEGELQAVLTGHDGRINRCAFSPDGTLLATTGSDRTARLWRVPQGDQQAVLTGHTHILEGCAFSPDGSLLATAGFDATVRLWHVPTGTPHMVLAGHTNEVERCAFSPDGATLATVGIDRTVRLWEVTSGHCRCAVRVAGPVFGLAWHPDGVLLGTTGAAGVYLLTYRS